MKSMGTFKQNPHLLFLPTIILWHFLLCTLIISTNCLASSNSLINESQQRTQLDSINGTLNYRIYGKKGRDEKPWFDDRPDRHFQCVRRGRCEKLNAKTCLGAKVPADFEFTSLDLSDYRSQEHVAERLRNYQALRYVPKCWAVIQPFLCAVFMPKCENINGTDMVYLPSLEMCRLTLEPCRILYNTSYFPEFLRCNETLFPSKCSNDVREMKFNLTGNCLTPLVAAESSASYYPGIEGCGVQCKDPLYTDDEHRQIQKLTSWCGAICWIANLFVVVTFIKDWENANKYPAVIIFYINLCFLIATSGWMLQFTPGSREDIVCRKDGTLRHSEPTAGENLSCIVIFVLIYYFLVAAMVWFVFLTYAWHLRAVGNVQDRIDKKGSYFHLVAWPLALVLTITTMALSKVDANSTVGICFVGYLDHAIRAGLVLGPLGGVILIGSVFIIRGMIMLFGLKHYANEIKSISASNKIHLIIVRMGVCAFFILFCIFVVIACHVYEFRHTTDWNESLKQFIICRISSTFTDDHKLKCKLQSRPSVAVTQLYLLCLFGTGIAMSSWCWTRSSINTWSRFIRNKLGHEVVEEVKMPKHKVIAQTWAKRKEFEDKGRLSITFCNTHTDPVGLNIDVNDINSSETNEISSTWANYLPKFVMRRNAITGATGTTNSSSHVPRKSSVDSEISVSWRHVSVESRRNSVDSQVSVQIAEVKTKVASRARGRYPHQTDGKHSSSNITKRSQRRRDFVVTAGAASGRRESSTSMESQVIALKKTTYLPSSRRHNTKRRSANAARYSAQIQALLANNELIIPFLQNQGLTTSSDEEVDEQSHSDEEEIEIQPHNATPQIEEIYDDDINDDANDRNAAKGALESVPLKSMQKSHDSAGKRHSRNSTRSRQSRKSNAISCTIGVGGGGGNSMRRSQRRIGKQKAAQKTDLICERANIVVDDEDDIGISVSSYSSGDLDILPGVTLNSSYSGISTGKPNSRNSKTSCDVGIQANACEIAEEERKETMRQLNAKNRRKSDNKYEDEYEHATEMQTLISNNNRLKEAMAMSESEKLKMLLLPSK